MPGLQLGSTVVDTASTATRIRILGLLALLTALAAGCGGSHRTMASVKDCLHEHGATIVTDEPAPAQQDPDVALLTDGYLGTIWGSIKGASFSVFVTNTAAYASVIPSGSDTDALLPIEPCVAAIDDGTPPGSP
jgi:hypothetical protein